MTKPTAPPSAVQAERDRIMSILALPAAKTNRAGAEALAFGSSATPAEAAAALARHADRKAETREMSAESMRRHCGLPTMKLRPGEITGLRHVMKTGRPADREDARKRLASAGVEL